MRNIKQILMIMASAAAFSLMGWGCSEDTLSVEDNSAWSRPESSSGRSTYYLTVEVNIGDGHTRAGDTFESDDADSALDADYVYGDEAETAIGSSGHYIIFFNDEDVLQMVYPLTLPNKTDLEPGAENGEGDKIQRRYWALLNDIEKENLPKKALVVLNGQSLYEQLVSSSVVGTTTLAQVLKTQWENIVSPVSIGRNEDGYFVMTNSTYYVGGEMMTAVPVTEKMYHELDDADQPVPPQITLPEDEILKIRVERLNSKISFRISDPNASKNASGFYEILPTKKKPNATNDRLHVCTGWSRSYQFTDVNGQQYDLSTEDWAPVTETREWRAVISGWNMNALEQNEYVYKSLLDANISNYEKFFTNWNGSSYYRSFWAEDPDYNQIDYPLQYREAYNRPITFYDNLYNGGGTDNKNLLVNYSYNDLNDKNFDKILYLPENTYDFNILDNDDLDAKFTPGGGKIPGCLDKRRDLLAGTHIILPATFQIKNEAGVWETKDFYRDPTGIYYESIRDCLWALVRQFNYALTSQERMRFDLFKWDPTAETSKGTYEIVYGVPTECISGRDASGNLTKVDDFEYILYYDGAPLTFDRIIGEEGAARPANYLTDQECNDILVAAMLKDGDGKRFVKSNKLSIQNHKGTIHEHLPLFSEYVLGADEETHQKIDNDEYFVGTTGDGQGYNKLLSGINDNDEVLSLLLEWGGWVDHYKQGRMYYAAPAAIEMGYLDDGSLDYDNEKGKNVYGLVRNAWYKYNLTQITEPGIPVDDETQPIVPNWGGPYDGVSVTVEMFDWHHVDLGSFDLGDIK